MNQPVKAALLGGSSNILAWPDLSEYGITLGIITLENDKRQLVYIDETGGYKHVAKNMGFQQTRWAGLWVRSDVRVEATAFRVAFPKVKVRQRVEMEIEEVALEKVRQLVEASRQSLLPGFDVLGPMDAGYAVAAPGYPKIKRRGGKVDDAAANDAFDITPLTQEARLLGGNLAAEDVFEALNGTRFTRFWVEEDTGRVSRTSQEVHRVGATDEQAARFLRGDSERSLAICAQGFVDLMANGHIARVDELHRFFYAVTGREFSSVDPDVDRVISAIDRARVEKINSIKGDLGGLEQFSMAMTLHEAAQYYSAVKSLRMTPLPVGVVFQHITASRPAGSRIRIENARYGEFGSISTNHADGVADVLLATYESTPLGHVVQAMGIAVNRLDHAKILAAIEVMPVDGLGVFVIEGDVTAGKIGSSSRRFLDALANRNEIEGIVDIDGSLMGAPGALPSRVIVVGAKREIPGHGGLPASIPFVTEYGALWSWGCSIGNAIAAPGSVTYVARGGVAHETTYENAFQAPYIPTSILSDPTLMVPRNLASPIRRAMINIMSETPDIDAWLMRRLGYSDLQTLGQAVSAEQADAVTMALHRAETGLGFMVADAPGIGKGRVMAVLARAAKIKGEPVIFLTETEALFTDFWRDVEDAGCEEHFKNVFIVNEGSKIISPKTGEVVAASAPRTEVDKVMRSMKFPPGVDIVFATYSQFNRDPVKAIKNGGKIDINAHTKNVLSSSALRLIDLADKIRMSKGKKRAETIVVEAVSELMRPEIIAQMPLSAVKSLWIGRATEGSVLLMDESHNASGESSQTNLNLTHGVMAAKSVCYSSATFARGEKNMRIYRRLFPASVDVEALHTTLKKGGEPLQEALTAMLATDGALIRREHDFSMLTFDARVDNKRLARNEQYADQLAEILAAMTALSRESRLLSDSLSEEVRAALVIAQGNNDNVGSVGVIKKSNIGNSLYTITKAFLAALTCDLAVEESVAALKEGKKPVIVFNHTLEAELERRISEARRNGEGKETADGFIMKAPNFQSMLLDQLNTILHVSVDGKDLGLRKRPGLAPIIHEIEKLIQAFPVLSTQTIDMVREGIMRAGYGVAELSGRKNRIRSLPDGNIIVQSVPKSERKSAVDEFNNGAAHALILTPAGNAGVSAHDGEKFLNHGQRVLVEAEVSEDVLRRWQYYGRVGRKGQRSYPIILTLSTGLPAQARILAISNNKTRKMSASITASSDNAVITKDVPDIFNVVGNEVAYRFLENDPELAQKLDIDVIERLEKDGGSNGEYGAIADTYVYTLMSRAIILSVKQQHAIIDGLSMEFKSLIYELEEKGENPLKSAYFDIHAKVIKSEALEVASLVTDAESDARVSCFDKPVNVSTIEYTEWLDPMPGAVLLRKMEEHRQSVEEAIDKKFGDLQAYQLWVDANPKGEFHDFLIESLIERKEGLLNRIIGRQESIASAIAKDDNNLVKQLNFKIDGIINALAIMKSGSRIRWVNEFRGTQDDYAIILGINPPEDDLIQHQGQYDVTVAVPGVSVPVVLTLASLLARPGFKVLETEFNPAAVVEFDSRKKVSAVIERPVLDGNLFRAAEMAIQTGQGRQAFYSDESGMAVRAVVMPLNFSRALFTKLPLRIHSADLATEFLNAVETGSLHSTTGVRKSTLKGSKLVRDGMSVKKTQDEIIVSVPGSQQWIHWLRNHSELMAVTGPFGGTRNTLFATVALQDVGPLVAAIYKTGVSMYAHAVDSYTLRVPAPPGYRDLKGNRQEFAQSKPEQVRAWFVKRFGAAMAQAENTKMKACKDVFAGLDGAGSARRKTM